MPLVISGLLTAFISDVGQAPFTTAQLLILSRVHLDKTCLIQLLSDGSSRRGYCLVTLNQMDRS